MSLSTIQFLRAHGIHLALDSQSGRLRYRAPAGGLCAELCDLVAETALEYEERAAIFEYDAGMTRKDAERVAAAEVTGCGDTRSAPQAMPWRNGFKRAERWGENHSSNPIDPRPIARSSPIDDLRRQVEKLKAEATQEAAKLGNGESTGKRVNYAEEIHRLESIIDALQLLSAAYAKCGE